MGRRARRGVRRGGTEVPMQASFAPHHRQAGFRRLTVAGVLALLTCLAPTRADAQPAGCAITTYTDPPREVLACADGLTISAERGAEYQLLDRNRDRRPDGAELKSRALLIELPARKRQGGFQILTPHAIASVRGTVWAVDV